MEAVRFTTYDGVDIAANLYLPEMTEAWVPGVIVCHGFGSSKEHYADFGELAQASGFAALIMDLRGHGESGGEMDANIFNDVAAALLYLQNRPEVHPMSISIRGSSFGGWLAIHTASHLLDISCVAAYACPSEAMLLVTMEEVSMVQRGHTSSIVTGPVPRVNVNSIVQLLYRVDVFKAARRLDPRALLLVHCEGDEVVPSHISQRIYDAAREPKTFWLLPGGDHRFAQHDAETDRRLLEWYELHRKRTGRLQTGDTGSLETAQMEEGKGEA